MATKREHLCVGRLRRPCKRPVNHREARATATTVAALKRVRGKVAPLMALPLPGSNGHASAQSECASQSGEWACPFAGGSRLADSVRHSWPPLAKRGRFLTSAQVGARELPGLWR